MIHRLAYLLDKFNIRNLCLVYFFVAPMLQDNADSGVLKVVVAVGYALSVPLTVLALSERLAGFSHRIRVTGVTLLVVLMVMLCFIGVAVNTPGNFLSPGSYYYKYLKLVFPVASFFVMISVWDIRDASRLYAILLASAAAAALFLIPEAIFFAARNGSVIPRLASFFIDANKFALFLNVVYAFTLPLLVRSYLRGRVSIAASLILFGLLVQIFLSQSRGGIVTTIAITLFCLLPRVGRKVAIAAFPLILGIVVFLAAAVSLRYVGGAEVAAGANWSNTGRLLTYSVGRNIVMDRPFAGIGFANILNAYEQYGLQELLLLDRPMAIHNTALEIFAEEGVFGMIVYLLLVFVPISLLVRKIRAAGKEGRYPVVELAALGIPIAFFGYGLTSPNYLAEDYFWVYMSFTILVIRSRISDDVELKMPSPRIL